MGKIFGKRGFLIIIILLIIIGGAFLYKTQVWDKPNMSADQLMTEAARISQARNGPLKGDHDYWLNVASPSIYDDLKTWPYHVISWFLAPYQPAGKRDEMVEKWKSYMLTNKGKLSNRERFITERIIASLSNGSITYAIARGPLGV